jgi:hypothetical protein
VARLTLVGTPPADRLALYRRGGSLIVQLIWHWLPRTFDIVAKNFEDLATNGDVMGTCAG